MDELTTHITELAFENCRQRRRQEPVAVQDLEAEMLSVWVNFRDRIIEGWASGLEAARQLSGSALEALMIEIDDALLRRVLGAHLWELPLWETEDPDEVAAMERQQVIYAAWGIACLWWTAHEDSAIAPTLHYTQGELQAWLRERERPDREVQLVFVLEYA